MLNRAFFALLALFWVTMNFLLWRAEYGVPNLSGTPVATSMIWDKILTAPDSSFLTIRHHGTTIGFCRWSTAVSEELATMDEAPSGAEPLRKYRIRLEGDIQMPESKDNLRFECRLILANRTDWSEFSVQARYQSLVVRVHSLAQEQTVHVSITNGPAVMDRTIGFNELQNPQVLLSTLVGPLMSGLRENAELPPLQQSAGAKLEPVRWQAWADTLYISHQPLRVYRINGRIAGLFDVVLHISPVGEIFKVQLPDNTVLLHDRMVVF